MVTDFSLSTIIEWCNSNQGFISGVLSLLTLFVSVIAICISIYAARIPYNTKIRIKTGVYFYNSSYQPCVIVSNIGNNQLLISYACVDTDLSNNIEKYIPRSIIPVKPGEYYVGSAPISVSQLKGVSHPQSTVLYGYVQLSNGKLYKKRLGTVKSVLNKINDLEAKVKDE